MMQAMEAPTESQNNGAKSGWWGNELQYQYIKIRDSSTYGIPSQSSPPIQEAAGEQTSAQAKVQGWQFTGWPEQAVLAFANTAGIDEGFRGLM